MADALNSDDMVAIAQKLQALAQSGLTYSRDVFDKERYETLQGIAATMLSSRFDMTDSALHHVSETGYATPKNRRAGIYPA